MGERFSIKNQEMVFFVYHVRRMEGPPLVRSDALGGTGLGSPLEGA